MRKLSYLTLITALIISVNSGLFGDFYRENAFLRGAINLLMLLLTYKFISMERLGMTLQKKTEGMFVTILDPTSLISRRAAFFVEAMHVSADRIRNE